MGVINGNDLRIRFDGVEVINSTSVSMNFSNELQEVTTESTFGWIERIEGRKQITGTFSGRLDYNSLPYEELKAKLLSGTKVEFDLLALGEIRFYGDAFIESFTESGASDDIAGYEGSFTVVGTLEQELVPDLELDILTDINLDPLTDINGEALTAEIL